MVMNGLFDSARSRGSDSGGGVMDRVVSQLLAEMDHLSRPDLLKGEDEEEYEEFDDKSTSIITTTPGGLT